MPNQETPARPRWFPRWALALCLVFPLAPSPALGWGSATHLEIARQAFAALPADLRAMVPPPASDLLEGMLDPDGSYIDAPNHRWCPQVRCGSAPEKIASEFSGIVGDFGPRRVSRALTLLAVFLPAGCSSGTGPLLGPPAGKEGSLAFRLGRVSHYLSDINAPYHVVQGHAREHRIFEDRGDEILSTLAFTFDGEFTDVGGDVAGFVEDSASESYRDLLLIMDRIETVDVRVLDGVIEKRFSRAVNDVVDLWYSILLRLR